MSREVVLSVHALTWEVAGRKILGPVDLEVRRGEFLAVVGQNGAGKTTLLRLMIGVLKPSAGSLYYCGEPYPKLSRRRLARRMAYVPQRSPATVPLTVEEVVLLGRFPYLSRFQIAPSGRDHAAVAEALEMVGIEALGKRPLDGLSGGERQLVYLAACLAQQADLILMDEPTTYLDPRHQRQIALLLRHLSRVQGKTVVTATHDLNFASLMADRVAALSAGRLVACEPPAKLFSPDLLDQIFASPFEIVTTNDDRPLLLVKLDD